MVKDVADAQPNAFTLSVYYSRPLAEVVAAGNYNYANPNITVENFPADKGDPETISDTVGVNVTQQAVLVHLDRPIKSEDVLAELERRGLRPDSMFELAHFGEQHPDIQRQFPVVALGSVWKSPDRCRSVGCLWGNGDDRRLDLGWLDVRWRARCRFLASRK
jgi:hypothetical protein